MAGFGELVLILGDMHIPSRAYEIPEKFKKMLVPNKMQHVICTGNLGCKEQYEELRNLAPNVHVVGGDMEYNSHAMIDDGRPHHSSSSSSSGGAAPTPQPFPDSQVIEVGSFRIGLVHGHQIVPWGDHMAIAMMRRKLDVDVLISGHTHKTEVVEHEGFYHINPGSITGAFSTITPNVIPSFILLAVQGPKVVCYVYELIDGEVDVSKTEFSKNELPLM